MMIDNYYMAWMICLFTVCLLLWQLATVKTRRQCLSVLKHYSLASLLSAGISAVILLPTIYSLLQSKATYTVSTIHNVIGADPLKILTKLVPGSFNFKQMPSGQPNIYVGMLMVFGFLLYLLDQHYSWRQRLVAVLITGFLCLSCCYIPLVLLWHAGQLPVWYPARFSYVFCFWLILLAAKELQPGMRISLIKLALLEALIATTTAYCFVAKVNDLTVWHLWFGLALAFLSLIYLGTMPYLSVRTNNYLLVVLAVMDVTTNAYLSLNQLAYITQPSFGNYTTILDTAIHCLPNPDQHPYRVAKTFMRTKDDPLQGGYAGGDHFGSTLEPQQPHLMRNLGQPEGDGSVTYSNGTQVTDDLLDFRYVLSASPRASSLLPLSGYRPDWSQLTTKRLNNGILIHENKNALPLAFGASNKVVHISDSFREHGPLNYQSAVIQSLAGKPTRYSLFKAINFSRVKFNNLTTHREITGLTFTKLHRQKIASLQLVFKPQTNGSYYLTLGPTLTNQAIVHVNNQQFSQFKNYRHTVVLNVAHHQKGQTIAITFKLKHSLLWMQDVALYRLKQRKFMRDLSKLHQHPLQITHYSSTNICGKIHLPHHELLVTTIPWSEGWHVKVNGKKVKPIKVLSTFIAIPLGPGTYNVSFEYRPPFLILGSVVSLLSLITVEFWRSRKRNKR